MSRADAAPRRRLLWWALLVAALASSWPASAEAHALIVMIGDSTTAGYTAGGPTNTNPANSLAQLLRLQPPLSRWRRAKVLNFGIFGSTTEDWLRPPRAAFCTDPRSSYPLLAIACARQIPLADAVLLSLPSTPDAVLIVLGVNDSLVGIDFSRSADNLRQLADALAPARSYIAPPFPVTGSDRTFAVLALRQALLDQGLLTGPDWPHLPAGDGLHLTDGGYAAAAGLWIDVLEKDP